jgi:hypothetical protein
MTLNHLHKNETSGNWSSIEMILSRNLKPVEPNPKFRDHLKQRLEIVETTTLEGYNRAKFLIYSALALVSGLMIITVWIRMINPLFNNRKFRRTANDFPTLG